MIEGVPVGDADGPHLSDRHDASSSRLKLLGVATAMAAIMLLVSIQGWIIDDVVDEIKKDLGIYDRVPVWERSEWPYITSQSYSQVMEFGEYEILGTDNEWGSTHHFVSFDLPLSEGGSAPNGVVSLAVWLPDVPAGVKVPVIAEFGPYFDEVSVETPSIEVPGTWLGQMIIDQILPHGYAFAQVSVMGTGRSNHCMDLMGNAE